MARDNSPKIRQRAQLERKQTQRASYDRVLIVSEGSKTEPLYFKEIKKAHRLQTANVEVHPSALGTEPIQVVRYAKQLFEAGDPYKRVRARAFEKVFALQQRDDSGALVGFQDIHSLAFLRGRPEHASCQQVPTVSALRTCPRSIQVGEFEVAISGGVWVAIRGQQRQRCACWRCDDLGYRHSRSNAHSQ